MTNEQLNILITAQNNAKSVLGSVKNQLTDLNNTAVNTSNEGLSSIKKNFSSIAGLAGGALAVGIGAVASSLIIGGKASLDNASKMESYIATLKVMLGSQEEANKRMKEYQDIGAKTPFELDDVVELGNQLQAIQRYSRDNVNMLGDLAAAANKPVQQVSGAYTKLATGQKGLAVDMFRDLLISTDDWVKATGKGVTKNGELMATTEEMLAVLPRIMQDKKFSGMMEEQAKTAQGIFSTMSDTINLKLTEVGDLLLPYWKNIMLSITSYVNNIDIKTGIESVQNMLKPLVDLYNFVKPVLDYFVNVGKKELIPIFNDMFKSLYQLYQALAPYLIPLFKLFAFVILTALIGALKVSSEIIKDVAKNITWLATSATNGIRQIENFGKTAYDVFKNIGSLPEKFIKWGLNGMIDNVNSMIRSVNYVIDIARNLPGANWIPKLYELPRFEKGGIVGGSSYYGDKILARVNSGELILNQKQQKKISESMDSSENQAINLNITFTSPAFFTDQNKKEFVKSIALYIQQILKLKVNA